MFLRTISTIAVAAVLAAGAPACAQTAAQGALLERALDAATAGDWPEAETLARRTGSKVAADLVTWVRLRDGAGDWDEYQRFLELHADWPGLAAMRRSAERQMPSGQDARGGLRLLRGRGAADRHRLAAPRRGALDQRPRARGRGRDRARLARLFDDRSRAAGGDGALEGGARAAPRARGSTCCSGAA